MKSQSFSRSLSLSSDVLFSDFGVFLYVLKS